MNNDAGMAAIALRFGAGAGIGLGQGTDPDDVAESAGLPRRKPKPPVFPFTPNPVFLSATAVGSYVTLGDFSPQSGWFADVTSLSVTGFTAGGLAVTKGAPAVTAAGVPVAIEQVATFGLAGVQNLPQKGSPLLDANDLLYVTVTSALTAPNGVVITGTAIMVPVARIDDYLS